MNFLFLNRVAVVRRMVKGQKEEEGQECPGQSKAGLCYRDGGTTAWQEGMRAAKFGRVEKRLKNQTDFSSV